MGFKKKSSIDKEIAKGPMTRCPISGLYVPRSQMVHDNLGRLVFNKALRQTRIGATELHMKAGEVDTAMTLVTGWNCITVGNVVPVTATEVEAEITAQNGSDIVQSMYTWNGAAWELATTIGYGEAIFLYCTAPGTYLPSFTKPDFWLYDFAVGTTSFGKSIGDIYTAVELGAEINGDDTPLKITSISRYVPSGWVTCDLAADFPIDFNIEKYGGYLIVVAVANRWDPAQ